MLSSIPTAIQEQLKNLLQTELKAFSFCGGGCINNGGKLVTGRCVYFLKWNNREKFPGMFEAEAKGLKLLAVPKVIHIPEVILSGETDHWQFLLLEFIDEKEKTSAYWHNLGTQLAALHRNTSDQFGLDHDNYIGSLPQINTPVENWIDFFAEQRLDVQIKLAVDTGKIGSDVVNLFNTLRKKLHNLLPLEKPSLLHGDLWSGNLITDSNGEPCLIDPAVYYGHREAELAFTTLFGGFSHNFYESYKSNFPLIPGYKDRFDIYNLYPLMVHVNLFGGGYASQVVSILRNVA